MHIYVIKNTVTGKLYVGQTRRSLQDRLKAHKRVVGRANACKALSDAMRKYGVDVFTIEPLRKCSSQEEMDSAEMEAIEALGTFYPGGYNLTRGGGGKHGYRHRPESIERTAAAHRGKPLTEEHRRKLSESLRGNSNAKGMKHTEETRRRLSEAQRGVKRAAFTDEHRAAIARSRRGVLASDDVRAKMSAAKRPDGKPRPPHNIGAKFGRWTVAGELVRAGSRYKALCRCDCGTERLVDVSRLTAGGTLSCGCLRNEQTAERNRRRSGAAQVATPCQSRFA